MLTPILPYLVSGIIFYNPINRSYGIIIWSSYGKTKLLCRAGVYHNYSMLEWRSYGVVMVNYYAGVYHNYYMLEWRSYGVVMLGLHILIGPRLQVSRAFLYVVKNH